MIRQVTINLPPLKKGIHLITAYILEAIEPLPSAGLLHLFLQHTSAALTINENTDPTVREDFEKALERLVPAEKGLYLHIAEGLDDMPAHIKASLLGTSLTIPIQDGRLALGVWQGIYLCEFRNRAYSRTIIATILS